MIPAVPMMLAALLAASEPPASAEAQASDAAVEGFLAAFRDATRPGTTDPSLDSVELEELGQLNPGRIDEIRPILEAEAACKTPLLSEMADRAMRQVARRLGDRNVERLTRFYQGEDFRLFGALSNRLGLGETLSGGEEAEYERILADYPVEEFAQRVQESAGTLFEDPAMDALIECDFDRRSAFERLGLRLYPVAEE